MSKSSRSDATARSGTAKNVLLVCVSVAVTLLLFEFVLISGVFDDLDNPAPVWFPPKYKEIDELILQHNARYARQNPYLFTDMDRDREKAEGSFRIAVIGDSFIWGHGVPYDDVWSHRLARRIAEESPDVEVMSWGRNGWQTLHQLEFMQKHGVDYDIDLLVVGFVTNDPDVGAIPKKRLMWQESALVKAIAKVLPNVTSFIADHINAMLYRSFLKDYGYAAWEDSLYSEENLQRYARVLQVFSHFCRSNDIRMLFVLTPSNHDRGRYEGKYRKIRPLLENAGIEYLDLLPVVQQEFGQYGLRELWANPVNGHPNPEVNEIFAREVFDYLKTRVFPGALDSGGQYDARWRSGNQHAVRLP